jgi:hypothetical protein
MAVVSIPTFSPGTAEGQRFDEKNPGLNFRTGEIEQGCQNGKQEFPQISPRFAFYSL